MDVSFLQPVFEAAGPFATLAAAVASSAGVVMVPRPAMPDEVPVAAVLRYSDASTPS